MKIQNFGDKVNSNGFDVNPENINKTGRPASIKRDLKLLMDSNGEVRIKADKVIRVYKNGDVKIRFTKSETLAFKLLDWAMSRNGNDSIRAIKMIMEQIEGKPDQKMEHTITIEPITGMEIK